MSWFRPVALAASVAFAVPATAFAQARFAQAQLPSLPPPPQMAPPGRVPGLPAAPPAAGQTQQPAAPQVQTPSGPPSPPGPYPVVSVAMAGPVNDPTYETFRKQLGAIASRKDRAGLTRLVAPSFFWFTYQGSQADKSKSAFDNFATAVELDATDGSGWEFLTTAAADTTLQPFKIQPGAFCAPAGPLFDYQAFDQLVKSTRTEVSDWAYTAAGGVPVRASATPGAPVVETLGPVLVRILPEPPSAPPPQGQQQPEPASLPVVTPAGKTGWVSVDDVWRLMFDQLCYAKDAGGWKIIGYLGGG